MKHSVSLEKIKSRDEAVALVTKWRSEGKKIGFSSGTFDLVHLGHVEYLEEAAQHCDKLVVAINSDSSVRSYKGPKRPICDQNSRARVIAGLACVALVFIFDEKNNNTNVKLLRPDFYVKAGDYSSDRMTSANIVEAYGGKVLIVPFAQGYSSSAIIEKILDTFADEMPESGEKLLYEKSPAVFLDRDGTINEEVDYIGDPAMFTLIPGAMQALRSLNDVGFKIIIVTNQPVIGFGYYSRQDFFRVNKEMLKAASKAGVLIHKVYYCPHTQADNCICRKPLPYFAKLAEQELNLDLDGSFMIGDRTGDVQFGKNAGLATILVRTGAAGKDNAYDTAPDYTVNDICEAVEIVLKKSSRKKGAVT